VHHDRRRRELLNDRIERLRELCLRFPESQEQPFGGVTTPTWRVNGKIFAQWEPKPVEAVWFKAAPGGQSILVDSRPEVYFVPPYMGLVGWVGARLASDVLDWDELAELIDESYRLIAPKRLRTNQP
jgi:predicted DNA-binding protein (MmcQ/YjbR family)